MNKTIPLLSLLIFIIFISITQVFAAEVRLYDFWSTEGGTGYDFKSWINEGNPSTQPYVMIANYGSLGPPRVECWDFSGTHDSPYYSQCRAVSETAMTECRNNCFYQPSTGRLVETALNWACANSPCISCPTTRNDGGYCAQSGSGYYMRIANYIDWTVSTSVSSPAFRVKYYYNCSPSLGDGTACKESSYGTGAWTNLASTFYIGNKKGTKCDGVGSRYFTYRLGYGVGNNSVQYGYSGTKEVDCWELSGTQGCDPAKAYWDSGANVVSSSTGTIANPCNGISGHPCTSNSQCIAALGLTCQGGFCLATETPPTVSNIQPPDFTTYPYNTGPYVNVVGRVITGNRQASITLRYVKNGGQEQIVNIGTQSANLTWTYEWGISVAPNETFQWRYCADTRPYSGSILMCSNYWRFSINPSPSYVPPNVILNSPPNGITYPAGTTNVTINYTVIAGSHTVNTVLYFDGNPDYSCSESTPPTTNQTYTCVVSFTGNSHNWKINYEDISFNGITNANTTTRFFYVNTTYLPPVITIDYPQDYLKGWSNYTNLKLYGIFIPAATVETGTDNLNLSFYLQNGTGGYLYWSTYQLNNTNVAYSNLIWALLSCAPPAGRTEPVKVCGPVQHWVQGVTPNGTWYNSSRPFIIYANSSYPRIVNSYPHNLSSYPAGTTMVEFGSESVSCGDIECKDAYIYLIIDDTMPILVGTQTASQKAKNWNYNKSITVGNHSYYWKIDNTAFGGTTSYSSAKYYFTVNSSEPGYVAPAIYNIAPPNGQVYPAGTTNINLIGNLTVGTFPVDTYYILDGVYNAIESTLFTNKTYNITIPVTAGNHTWTFGVTDYYYSNGTTTNWTDTPRIFTIQTSMPTIAHLSPPSGSTGRPLNNTVIAQITTTAVPAYIRLKYILDGVMNIIDRPTPQAAYTSVNYTYTITAETSRIVRWQYCVVVDVEYCHDLWNFTTMDCKPENEVCTENKQCCSGYCSRGYCHYDTGFYELNLSENLVNPNNPLCKIPGQDCGLIPEIYYGTLRVFSKIGMPFIFIVFTILLCLIMLSIGGFILRVARGP